MAVTPLERRDVNGDLPAAPPTSLPTGCRALLWALLEDVFIVRDTAARIAPGDGRYRILTGAAASDREWLASESDGPFSFLWVCHHLGLEPDVLRRCYDRGHAVQSNLLAGWKNCGRSNAVTVGRIATRRRSAYAPRAVI